MKRIRTLEPIHLAMISCSTSFLYAVYHGYVAFTQASIWFSIMCTYYSLLVMMKLASLWSGYNNQKNNILVTRINGILLIAFSIVFSLVIYVSSAQSIVKRYDTITMITIATYTFYKIITTTIKYIKTKNKPLLVSSQLFIRINCAEVLTSVLTLQRSMLASFGDLNTNQARVMNMLTGAAVCLLIVILGILVLIEGKEK